MFGPRLCSMLYNTLNNGYVICPLWHSMHSRCACNINHSSGMDLLNLCNDLPCKACFDSMRLHNAQSGVCPQVTLAEAWLLEKESNFSRSSFWGV